MKHRFLLDENILHFAIKGVDRDGNPDRTSTQLVQLVAHNCHSIILNEFLRGRYWFHVNQLITERDRTFALEPVFFIVQLLKNSLKWVLRSEECPQLPQGAPIPNEDIEIVRLALLAGAVIVTGDEDLQTAVNNSAGVLHIQALTPGQALNLAEDM